MQQLANEHAWTLDFENWADVIDNRIQLLMGVSPSNVSREEKLVYVF